MLSETRGSFGGLPELTRGTLVDPRAHNTGSCGMAAVVMNARIDAVLEVLRELEASAFAPAVGGHLPLCKSLSK